MSQSFSLYSELTVRQNLDLHVRLFHLPARKAHTRLHDLVQRFGLADYLDQRTSELPLGIRQRLSLAVAIVHEPEMLILDEPTSGVDPLARDRFWELLIDLSRKQGVTIFVSTHFMNEAERCDRISLMDSGRVLATDTPRNLIRARGAATLEDAFVGYLEEAAGSRGSRLRKPDASGKAAAPGPQRRRRAPSACGASSPTPSAKRLELMRDPIRLGFALFGTAFLMLVFGFGISTDVNNLSFAVLDHDQSHESRAYLEELRGSHYFVEKPPLANYADLETRLQSGDHQGRHRDPTRIRSRHRARSPGLGRCLGRWLDAVPRRDDPRLSRGHAPALSHRSGGEDHGGGGAPAARIEVRFKYNQDFESVYAMVPSTMALLLALFPAILMALAIVREKELGSITNLYVTPVTRIEFLLGKQIPYIGVAMTNFALMFLMALFLFEVPLKGSFLDARPRCSALRHRDHGLRHAHFGLRQDPDRGAVRHRDPHRAASDAILRHDDAGLVALRHRPDHGPGVPDDLFRADQRRRLHQGTGVWRPAPRPDRPCRVHPGPDDDQSFAPAQAGALRRRRCARLPISSGLAPRKSAASSAISCCWGW